MVARVCVIGFGASGIASVQQLLQKGLHVTCYEARSESAGVWLYDSQPGELTVNFDRVGRPIASSSGDLTSIMRDYMYSAIMLLTNVLTSLQTNLPCPLMGYRSAPFPPHPSLYPHHLVVTKYLQQCGRRVEAAVHYKHLVNRIRYSDPNTTRRRWFVTVTNLADNQQLEQDFDFILVANGHYSLPYIPYYEGLWNWKRSLRHTRTYRRPEEFAGLNVLIIGSNASGSDITREIATYFSLNEFGRQPKIYQSVRNEATMFARVASDIVEVVPAISMFTEDSIHLVDGRTITDVDVVLCATGYLVRFPFCNSKDEPFKSYPLLQSPPVHPREEVIGQATFPDAGLVVHNLDSNGIFYYPDPTLAFVALHYKVVPFQLAEVQARVVAARWSGLRSVPLHPGLDGQTSSGLADEASLKEAFTLGANQFDYEDALTDLIGEGIHRADLLADGKFGYVSQERRDLRAGGAALRQASLGH